LAVHCLETIDLRPEASFLSQLPLFSIERYPFAPIPLTGASVRKTNSLATTITINAATPTEYQGIAVSQANGYVTTTMTINSATLTENQGVAVTQANGYVTTTITINSARIAESQGVVVTQAGT
jgi:hypothetical protein